jgi:hypothetical protein
MEKLIDNLIVCFFCALFINNAYCQELKEPVIIHPLIGTNLDRVEEDYFKLFPTIKNFQEAEFYLNPDSSLKAIVIFESNGVLIDTVMEKNFNAFQIRSYIDQKLAAEINAEQNVDRGKYVNIQYLDESKCTGELLSIRDSSFLLLNMEEATYLDDNNSNFDVSHIKFADVSKVTSVDKTNIARFIYPIVAGLTAVLIYSSTVEPEKTNSISEGVSKATGNYIIGAIIGGIACSLGYVLGGALPIWITSETEYISPFNEKNIDGLSQLSRYKVGEPYYLQKVD